MDPSFPPLQVTLTVEEIVATPGGRSFTLTPIDAVQPRISVTTTVYSPVGILNAHDVFCVPGSFHE